MTQDKLKTKDDTKMYLGAVYQVSYVADSSRCYQPVKHFTGIHRRNQKKK